MKSKEEVMELSEALIDVYLSNYNIEVISNIHEGVE